MKKLFCFSIIVLIIGINNVYGQFDISKKVKKEVEKRVNKNIDQGIDTTLNKVEKGIKGDGKKNDKTQPEDKNNKQATEEKKDTGKETGNQDQPSLQTYSKYDFVPGEKIIFFDDFTAENVGDFPIQWNTTGSGEVVTTNLYDGRWFNITNGRGATTLDEPLVLPDNYTIEFDVVKQKDPNNNNGSDFSFNILSTSKPKDINYGLARPGDAAIRFEFAYSTHYFAYYRDGTPDLSGNDNFRLLNDKKYRISIWVQKERIRLYVDEKKVFDLPKAMSKKYKYNMIRFDRGVVMVGNVRVATGFPDMRSKLLTEGKLISYGIYFDVNKDVVKPESYPSIKEIASILKDNPTVNIKIVGHTDSDGDDKSNLDLSKRRAASVKNVLIKDFSIDAARIETDGKGESEPIAKNDSAVNKALNRRVEFIKL
jgi:OOP family OmpA-OmpF porin